LQKIILKILQKKVVAARKKSAKFGCENFSKIKKFQKIFFLKNGEKMFLKKNLRRKKILKNKILQKKVAILAVAIF